VGSILSSQSGETATYVSSIVSRLVSDYRRLISLPAYSFTCANGICENNCRSMIMFNRRSN